MVADFPDPPTQGDEPVRGHPRGVGYTMMGHDLRRARPHLHPAAQAVLWTIEDQATGYHRERAVLSYGQIASMSNLSVKGVRIALKELSAKRIISALSTGSGRATETAYSILPEESWSLTGKIVVLSTTIAGVNDNVVASTTIQGENVVASTTMTPINVVLSSPLIKKDISRKKREKEIPVGEAQAPRVSSASRKRKLTDEQLEAHKLEAKYVSDLIALLRSRINVKGALPTEGRERQAAHWFYRENATIETVMAFYETMKLSPFWGGKYLSLAHVEGPYSEHQGDVAAYQAAEARSRRHGSGQTGTSASQHGAGGATGGVTQKPSKYAGVMAAARAKRDAAGQIGHAGHGGVNATG